MIPRDRTHRLSRGGKVVTFSPPSGVTWGGRFGLHVYNRDAAENRQTQVLLTPGQARGLAADLLRRARDVERREGRRRAAAKR